MLNKFKLHYYRHPLTNFGDELNGWMWERLAPGAWVDVASTSFCGIGTLIDTTLPSAERRVIFSSGVGYGPLPDRNLLEKTRFACVRGPLSARVLGLESNVAVTDGAALLSFLPECQPLPENERKGVVFMPHHLGMEDGQLEEACRLAGIEYLSPHDDSKSTVQRLRSAKLVIADAMHAAIVADTLRVPWVPVQTSSEINSFKWLDWTRSLDLPYRATRLPSSSALEAMRNVSLVLRAGNFAVKDATVDAALAHYQRYQSARLSSFWVPRRNIVVGLHKRAVRPLLRSALLAPLVRQVDRRALERTVDALRKSVSLPSYLSNDKIFDDRRFELASRLAAETGRAVV
jgi:succinoglycan biosynthesis protein ExoV